jgi:hypothetical protein
VHDLAKPPEIEETTEPKEAAIIRRRQRWKNEVSRIKEKAQLALTKLRKDKDKYQDLIKKIESLTTAYNKLQLELREMEIYSENRIIASKVISLSSDSSTINSEIVAIDLLIATKKKLQEKCAKFDTTIEATITTNSAILASHDSDTEQKRIAIRDWQDTRLAITGNATTPQTIEYIHNERKRIDSEYSKGHAESVALRNSAAMRLLELIENRESKLSFLYEFSNREISRIAQEYRIDRNDFVSFSSERLITPTFKSDFLQFINLSKQGAYYHYKDAGDGILDRILGCIDISDIKSIASLPAEVIHSLCFQLDDMPEKTGLEEIPIDGQLKRTKKELYDYLFSFQYLRHQFTINYSGKPIEYLSPGEKGILLLSFFLLFDSSNKPIIIDQPEENLDNETIFNRLVKFVRKAKSSRQIIIVTHNPNLGIVCDSEQLVVAKISRSKGNRVRYESGAIEDSKMKAYALQILEGTQPAFESRIMKYSI